MKLSENDWVDVGDSVSVDLKEDRNELSFRTINLAGVVGEPSTIIVARGE